MTVWIALLRGINVGGNKKIKMAELKTLFESLGLENVQTLLQSGNVVFQSDHSAETLTRDLEAGIQKTFGFESRVILRTREQFRTAVEQPPYSAEQLKDPAKILVMFLAADPAAVDLAQEYSGPEQFFLRGRELYLYYPDGMGRSKLSNAWLERKLKTVGTGRNWNTITKLVDLSAGL